jgi:hypothetical protein
MWSNTITPIQLNTTCQNLGSTWSTCKSRDVIGRVGSTGLATGPMFVIVLEKWEAS